jgi:DNA replication protein DnaC
VCFFCLGAFSASGFLAGSLLMIIPTILFVVILWPSLYWYRTKMYLQSAQYPFQFRLSQWDAIITDNDKKKVNKFLINDGVPMHLFIFGSKGSGKTSLGVGISTERSIRQNACLYTTVMKLFSMFYEEPEKLSETTGLWSWRDCSTLIIDDINPGFPIKDIVKPEDFLKLMDKLRAADQEIIKNKNIIWILGNDDSDDHLNNWRQMLCKISVKNENILSVSLPVKK